jgi:membrane associated rhomboid family serine protease
VSGAGTPSRRGWTITDEEARAVLGNARRAFFVMVGVLAVLWIIQIINAADSYHLTYSYGVIARDTRTLPYILTSPFLHFRWSHIEGNSGPLFIFGFLAAYRGLGKFVALTIIVILTSGFAAWFFGPTSSVEAGASGVTFGYFGYIMVRGIFDRRGVDVLIGAVMALCFAYQFSVLWPHKGLSWQAHVGGLIGGIIAGWLLRDRAAARAKAAARTSSATPAAMTAAGSTAVAPTAQPASAQALPATKPAKPGKGGKKDFQVDPANPRADLYKQLDDMGL